MATDTLTETERKQELALLFVLEQETSAGAKRDKCEELGISWDEYKRFCRKWSRVLEAYRNEQKEVPTSDGPV